FGTPFGYLIGLMVVMAFRSIYEAIGGAIGSAAVPLLSFFLLVSPTSRYLLVNTPGFFWTDPGAPILEEKWVEAMNRFTAVILGNAPHYHSGTVYLTPTGYYHVPVMDYAFLKKDPALRWSFASYWQNSEPKYHLDFIHNYKEDFVIAGQANDGLSFPPPLISGANGSANAVLIALWKDPDYMPIDQFYGPAGRTITVFQRSTSFAGWRPLSGLHSDGTAKPWFSTASIVYLQSYAPVAISGKLEIGAVGSANEKFEVIINQKSVGQLSFDQHGKALFTQAFNLLAGQNDIVLKRSGSTVVEFDRLLVVRNIERD